MRRRARAPGRLRSCTCGVGSCSARAAVTATTSTRSSAHDPRSMARHFCQGLDRLSTFAGRREIGLRAERPTRVVRRGRRLTRTPACRRGSGTSAPMFRSPWPSWTREGSKPPGRCPRRPPAVDAARSSTSISTRVALRVPRDVVDRLLEDEQDLAPHVGARPGGSLGARTGTRCSSRRACRSRNGASAEAGHRRGRALD